VSGNAWTEWGAEPAVWSGIGLLALAYGLGLAVLWRRAGIGHGIRPRQAAAFAGGLLALVLALASPVDHLAEELLSAHMVQHLLLVMVAAPLLVLGEPMVAFAWALPRRPRLAIAGAWHRAGGVRHAWRWVSGATVAWVLHLAALYVWHLPVLYQAALASELLHALEHAFFLGTGLLFWYALLRLTSHRRTGHGAAVLYLFAAAMAETPLGALMLFSQQLWYPVYAATAPAYGLTGLEDQQLAGTIMWVPPGVLMLGIATVMFLAWFEALERRMKEREDAI
jgi:putative membrane protein